MTPEHRLRTRFLQKPFLLLLMMTSLYAVLRAEPPVIDGCQMFPANNPWNTDISNAPVHPLSDVYIGNIQANGPDTLQAGFGEDPVQIFPWITVDASQPKVSVNFLYASESEPGPYPIPDDIPIEGGEDRHAVILEKTNCILYELYLLEYNEAEGQWYAGSGAIFDLKSNALRPDRWTSADAAGLPMLPGLVKCDEVLSGEINHAFRVAVNRTQRAYTYPATHFASEITDPAYPPMGTRLRLKANYDLSGFTGQSLVVAQTLKTYGMMIADNGVNWIITGEGNPDCWSDDDLKQLNRIPGTALEVVISPPPPAEDGNLIQNGGFEGADTTKQALAWTIKNKSGEKRVCDGISITNGVYRKVSFEGYCAYTFVGRAGADSQLRQKTALPNIPGGTSFVLSAQVNGEALPTGSLRLMIKYRHPEGTKDKWTLPLGEGTFEFTSFTQTVTSTGVGSELISTLKFSGSSGKAVVDAISLKPAASRAVQDDALVPLP